MVATDQQLELPRGRIWRLGPRPQVLGVLNCTPDSFSDGGRFAGSTDAVAAGAAMVRDGADALDIGGESTRPGAATVSTQEQTDRVAPVIEGLRRETDVPISIDTRDPRVGEAALAAGADIINDVSACRDPGWIPVLRGASVPVILMHMRGTPADMQEQTSYPNGVVEEIASFLAERLDALEAAGIARARCIVDPGIGFAKEAEHNLDILAGLDRLARLGRPILFGASRKFFLGKILGARVPSRARDPRERDVGTVAVNAIALAAGASILRVHNVAYTRDLVDVFEALRVRRAAEG